MNYYKRSIFIVLLLVVNAFSWSLGGGGAVSKSLVVDAKPTNNMFFSKKTCEDTTDKYRTIQEAINDANDGDTISICDETYEEQVSVTKNNLTIKKSDSAGGDVIVKNSGDVFTLNGVDGITIDSIKIEQTSGNDGISVKSYSKDILLKNMIITSASGDGIETYGSNGKFTIENSTIEADDEGIDFSGVISEVTISDTNITTTGTGDNHGVKSEEIINNGITIKNTIIDTKAIGLYFKKNVNGGLNIVDSKIKSKSESLELTKIVNGGVTITNSSFNSTEDDAIDFNNNINNGLTITDTNITAMINSLEIAGDVSGVFSVSNCKINAGKKGFELSRNINNGFSIENTTIEAQTFGIENIGQVSNGITISNSNIKADIGEAIALKKITDGFTVSDTILNSKSYAIKLEDEINGGIELSNVDITSIDSNGVKVDNKVTNGIIIRNSRIIAGIDGLEFDAEISGEVNISDINISANHDGLDFGGKINTGIKIKNCDINSSSAKGIYFQENIYNYCDIDNIVINSKDRGIYFHEKQITSTIINSNIKSSNSEAIYTKNMNGSKFTLKDSCLKTEKSDRFSLWINNSSTNAEVSGNCFYAPRINGLGKARASGNNVNGNYWDLNSGDYIHNNISDTSTLANCNLSCSGKAVLLADYHFDECSVSNDANKVDDNSSNDNNATAFRDVTSTDGKINSAYDFDGVDLPDYVSVPSVVLDAKINYSFSMWVKPTSLNNKDTFISAEKTDEDGDELLFRIDNGKVAFKHKGTTGQVYFDTRTSNFTLNEWNYIALTKKGKEVCFYLNGNTKDCKISSSDAFESALGVLDGTFMIGQDSTGIDTHYVDGNFEGAIDEVKFFEDTLSEDEVSDIYNNEKSGKNYDGTTRDEMICSQCRKIPTPPTTPLEFEGAEITLNTTTQKPHWTHIDFQKAFSSVPIVFVLPESRGSHPATVRLKDITTTGFDAVFSEPQGEDGPHLSQNINYLAVNEGIHDINNTRIQVGKVGTQKVQQANQGNLIKNEWENIGVTFNTCNLSVVAQIQSLVNETGLGSETDNKIIRSKPFLTTAISSDDGVQLALERSETDEGTITDDETIGYMIALPNTQDSVVDDNNNKVLFETIKTANKFVGWDDSCQKVNFVNSYSDTPLVAANKNSKNEKDGGWFRRCTLNKNKIGLKIDEDRDNQTKYGAKNPPQDSERNHIAEVGSIFVFSENIVIRETSEDKEYSFDTWDITKSTEPTLNSRDILTKIANASFDLHLSEVNATDYNDDFDGTVCSVVFDTSDKTEISDWVAETWTSSDNEKQKDISFIVNKAVKVARVYTYWHNDGTNNCSGIFSHENNETNSTDDFAIRPNELVISSINDLKAGDAFTFEVTANTDNYNITLNINVDLNDTSKTCDDNRADFNLTSVDFKDGDSSTSAKFDEVGIVDINITDKTWAEVDNDDTPQNCDAGGTYVCSNTIQAKIYPAKFGVNFKVHPKMENNSTADNFTYLSSDLNMSGWLRNLDINISALNSANEVTKNFDKECYEDSVKVDFILNRPKDDNSNDANLTYNPDDNDKSAKLDFEKGLVDINNSDFGFNFTRVYDKPRNPFFVDGSDSNVSVDIEDNNYTDAKGNVISSFDDNTTFYYGRISTADKETTDNPIPHFSEVEVYDNSASSYVSGFKQNSINWYANAKHSDAFITLLEINATKKSTLNDVKFSISSFTTDSSKVDFNISNDKEDTYRMHIKIKPWFWYFPSSIGKVYNEADGSDCTEHPCFEYILKENVNASGVRSGTFKGSDHNISSRGKYEKTGIKVFR